MPVGMSAVSITSFTATGTPCSGPRLEPLSHARACRSACSESMKDQAFSTGSRSAMRARQAVTKASEVISPEAISLAASVAESSFSAPIGRPSMRHHLPFHRLAALINQRALIGPIDLHLFRRDPRALLQRDGLIIWRQAVMFGAVERGESFQPVERVLFLKYFGIGRHRHRRVENAGDADHRELL